MDPRATMLDAFCKEATEAQQGIRAFTPGDMRKRTVGMSGVGKERQAYTAPNPPAAPTRPDLVQSQKALTPPPVQ
jgi:hypothetical protein